MTDPQANRVRLSEVRWTFTHLAPRLLVQPIDVLRDNSIDPSRRLHIRQRDVSTIWAAPRKLAPAFHAPPPVTLPYALFSYKV